MRQIGIIAVLLLIVPLAASASPQLAAPTSAPEDKSDLAQTLSHLFDLPHSRQTEVRQQLANEADLPALLGGLLGHADQAVRRTSLALLRDHYGDWPVVSAVQSLLASELSRQGNADGYVLAACCEILADWPRWDSIPVLLEAMKADQQVAGQGLSARYSRGGRVAVWRQVDAALRLISGEWPMPEPDASSQKVGPPGSAQDRAEQQSLQKTWGDWWMASGALPDPMPQVRIELTWTTPAARRLPGGANGLNAVASSLWVRPTGSARRLQLTGLAEASGAAAWKWDERSRRDYELHLNSTGADAARALALAVVGGATGEPWGVPRPAGLPDNWRGRILVTTPYGQTGRVELTDLAMPGAVRPPALAGEALMELLPLVVMP